MASCGDTITLDAMLRSALRKWGGCGVIAIEYTSATDPIECRTSTMEMLADAVNDGLLRVDEVTCSGCDPLECGDASAEELLREAFGLSEDGHVLKCANVGEETIVCEPLECGLTTSEMIRRAFVMDTGERRVRTISAVGDLAPFDCDWKDKSSDELLRLCMVDTGSGAYAFRVQEHIVS